MKSINQYIMKINKNIAVSDSGFLFNPSSGESFSLNQSGKELFQMVKDGKNRVEIQNDFLTKYDIDASTFEKDFQDFTEMLEQYHLVETPKEQ